MGPRRARRRVAEGVDAAARPGLREREREGVATGRQGQEPGLLLQLQEGTRGPAEEPDCVHCRGLVDGGAPGSAEAAQGGGSGQCLRAPRAPGPCDAGGDEGRRAFALSQAEPQRCTHGGIGAARRGRPGGVQEPARTVRDHSGRRAGPPQGEDLPDLAHGVHGYLPRQPGDRRHREGADRAGPSGEAGGGRGESRGAVARQMKILVSDVLSKQGIEILEKAGLTVNVKTKLSKEDLLRELKHYDGLIVRSATKVTAEVIAAAGKLRVIGRAGSGLDNVDTAAATKRGIVVMNTPGGNTVTTAEHTLALILALARKIPQATASMKGAKWEKDRFMGVELYNKTLGIVGVGQIGSHLAKLAQGMMMTVIAYDPSKSGKVAGAAFDVFEEEPVKPSHPLLTLDNFICTPHIGAATTEAQENVAVGIAEQIVDYLTRGIARGAINIPSVPAEMLP